MKKLILLFCFLIFQNALSQTQIVTVYSFDKVIHKYTDVEELKDNEFIEEKVSGDIVISPEEDGIYRITISFDGARDNDVMAYAQNYPDDYSDENYEWISDRGIRHRLIIKKTRGKYYAGWSSKDFNYIFIILR